MMFEGEFVELLFSIAAKIRLSPGILQAWFTTRGEEEGGREFESLGPQQRFAGITNKVRREFQFREWDGERACLWSNGSNRTTFHYSIF